MSDDPAVEAMLLAMFKRSGKTELPLAWEAVRSEARIALAAAYEAEAEELRMQPEYTSIYRFLVTRIAALRGAS
jgi:hypothetical protein